MLLYLKYVQMKLKKKAHCSLFAQELWNKFWTFFLGKNEIFHTYDTNSGDFYIENTCTWIVFIKWALEKKLSD
jgi:hypothetical protein